MRKAPCIAATGLPNCRRDLVFASARSLSPGGTPKGHSSQAKGLIGFYGRRAKDERLLAALRNEESVRWRTTLISAGIPPPSRHYIATPASVILPHPYGALLR